MSVLEEVLLEEYERSSRIEKAILEEQKTLPRGSIQVKRISNKVYHYLMYRKGKKVISEYIRQEEVDKVKQLLEKRKNNENTLRELADNKKIVIKSLGKDFINEHTK